MLAQIAGGGSMLLFSATAWRDDRSERAAGG